MPPEPMRDNVHLKSLIEYFQGVLAVEPRLPCTTVRVDLLSRFLLVLSLLGCSVAIAAAETSVIPQTADEVLSRYLKNNREQRTVLRDVSMTVDIEAKLPDLQKKGVLQALRKVSKLGQITYKVLGFEGDNMVKKDVIARYIEAEMKSSGSDTRDALAINADNYRFNYWGRYGSDGWVLHLFELKPKRKRLGLYEGWLWIRADSAMPVRESGRLVKNPSVFLKRVDFIKDFILLNVHCHSVSKWVLPSPQII